MTKWIKRIGLIAFLLVCIELVAWVGLALFGIDQIEVIKDELFPGTPTLVEDVVSGAKCALYNGETFCLEENR